MHMYMNKTRDQNLVNHTKFDIMYANAFVCNMSLPMLNRLGAMGFWDMDARCAIYRQVVGVGRNGKNAQVTKETNINSKKTKGLPCQLLDFGEWVPMVLSHLLKQWDQNILVVHSGFDGDLCFQLGPILGLWEFKQPIVANSDMPNSNGIPP